MTKKILDFQKGAFSSWYGVVSAMQDQTVSSMTTFLNQSDWMPEESRRMVLSWVNACQKGRDDVKELLEESFSGIEKVFVKPIQKTKPAKRSSAKAKPAAQTKPHTVVKSKAPTSDVRVSSVTPAPKPTTEIKPTQSVKDKEKTTK